MTNWELGSERGVKMLYEDRGIKWQEYRHNINADH
jgi:hypothetical protein